MAGFRENEWMVLGVPDGGERLVQLKLNEFIDLGRFGRFPARHLLGAKSESYYSISSDGSIIPSTPHQLAGEATTTTGEDVPIVTATNQELLDTNTSQRLSTADVEALKEQVDRGVLPAAEVVRTLIQNSETFESKNAFSQIKYVQRKQRKFLKWFVARKATVRTLTSYFMKRDPRKIMDLRLDALSQLLCLANVQAPGAKILIWDETVGFLTGAVLTKVAPGAIVINVHPDRQMQVSSLMYYNLPEERRRQLHSLPIAALKDRSGEEDNFIETPGADPERLAIQRQRYETRRAQKLYLRGLLDAAAFDTLLIATQAGDAADIIARLAPHLRPSAVLVAYSTWRDLLLPTYMTLRRDPLWVDVSLHESFLRPYQAATGRFHPAMNCNGHSGTLLAATKIQITPCPRGGQDHHDINGDGVQIRDQDQVSAC